MATLSRPWPGRLAALAGPFLACLLSGCGADHYPGDLPGAKLLDPNKVPADDRAELGKALQGVFGTPAAPLVKVEDDAVENLRLSDDTLKKGSSLYRRHCLHCHGLAGD